MSVERSTYSLAELIGIKHGWAFKGDFMKENLAEGPIVVAIGNYDYSGGFRFNKTRVKKYTADFPEEYILKAGDMLLAMTCQTAGGEILGIPGIIPSDDNIYLHNQRLGKVIIKEKDLICIEYLYWLFLTKKFNQYIFSSATGTKILHTSPSKILSYEDKFPAIDEQKKIASVLWQVAYKIELNRQTNQTIEQIAQTLFKSWFVDFEPTHAKIAAKQAGQDPERAAMAAISGKTVAELEQLDAAQLAQLKTKAALFPDRLVESEFGEVPEGWEVRKLKDICRVLNGRAYKNTEFKESGTPIVRIQNLSNGGKGGKTVYSDLDLPLDKLIHKEDFIYAWSATFGPHIWRGPKSIYHYHIWKMDVNESVISRYFLYLSMFRKTEQMKSGATGSIFTHLTKATMESQEILVGSHALNMSFKSTLEQYFQKITQLNEENRNLETLRNTLLPKLLSGELSPTQTEAA